MCHTANLLPSYSERSYFIIILSVCISAGGPYSQSELFDHLTGLV